MGEIKNIECCAMLAHTQSALSSVLRLKLGMYIKGNSDSDHGVQIRPSILADKLVTC